MAQSREDEAETVCARAASTRPTPVPDIPTAARHHVGRYRLCLELGSGGMAKVYLACAEDAAGGKRFVALKRMHRHFATDPAFVQMFLDEGRIASRVCHANVCGVVEFGAADGEYYLALEHLVGESLSKVLIAQHKQPKPADGRRRGVLIARVIADICEGLHAVHELRDTQGKPLKVVHRDISPENIFITYDGVAKLTDFGIARASRQLHATNAGELKGKFAYMAPELIAGQEYDRRSDVWALGVVLWELLTRRRLFRRANDAETLQAVSQGNVPAPSAIDPRLPKQFDEVVARALTRDPAGRYQSARELGRRLIDLIAEERCAIGLADIADWMDQMFPEGRAAQYHLLEVASRMTDSDVDFGEETTYLRVPEYTFCSAPTQLRKIVPGPSATNPPPPATRRRLPWLVVAAAAALCGVLFTQADGSVRAEAPSEPLRAGLIAFAPATPLRALNESPSPRRVDLSTVHVSAADDDDVPRVLRLIQSERAQGCNVVLKVVSDDQQPKQRRALPATQMKQSGAQPARRVPAEVAYSSATPGRSETLAP